MSSGTVYPLRPSAPLIAVIGSSPLLPTPTAQDGDNVAGSSQLRRNTPPLNAVVRLLPTPMRGDGERGPNSKQGMRAEGNPNLPEAIKLLPTPAEADSRNTRNATANDGEGSTGHSGTTLSDVAHRWKEEVQLLPTPRAAVDKEHGPNGQHWAELRATVESLSTGEISSPPSDDGNRSSDLRLSPWFVEWMMGMPEGWSDPDCPLSAMEFSARSGFSPASTSPSASGSE